MTPEQRDKTRHITILCSLDSHSICVSEDGYRACQCECHFTKIVYSSGEEHSFEERLAALTYELWRSAHNLPSLSRSQIRAAVLKFYKKHQTPNPMDYEVDVTTDLIQAALTKEYWSRFEWDDEYAAREKVQPSLF